MSDTPRTDALHYRTCAFGDGYRMSVLTDMCRELERELAAVTAERDALRENLDTHRQRLAKAVGGWKAGRTLIEQAVSDLITTDTIDGSEPSETAQILEREVARFIGLTDALMAEATDLLGCVAHPEYGTLRDTRQRLSTVTAERDEWRRALMKLTPGGSEFADDPARCAEFVQTKFDRLRKASINAAKRGGA